MAEENEPSLPPLSAISKRKRARIDRAPPSLLTSSDPAFFSSDDDPSLDNYTHGRRKKRYAGSWFQQHPAASDPSLVDSSRADAKPKRTFERQFDSGVWMGSDGTDIDEIIEGLEVPAESRISLPSQPARAARVIRTSAAEIAAQAKIRECIENGDESIDLSSMGLEALSNATIAALSEFSCIPTVEKEVPFVHKDPSLKLYLFSNRLTTVPGAIFSLEHLTVLSLRNNGLKELPPAISKLTNLKSLNVSLNALRYLPAELLELIATTQKLTILQLHPNPFYQPRESLPNPEEASGEDSDEEVEGPHNKPAAETRAWLDFVGRYHAELQARTPVEFSDSTGRVYSDFKLLPESDKLETEDIHSAPDVPSFIPYLSKSTPSSSLQQEEYSKVPTLLELALQSCYRAPHLNQLPTYLPDHTPPHMFDLLDRALDQRDTGGLTCSICKNFVVKPRTEWVEWWDVMQPLSAVEAGGPGFESLSRNEEERLVPFIRRGCSWRCVPRRVE